ncbi:MAG: fluoride efflux transporter FluC [Microcella pacifica]
MTAPVRSRAGASPRDLLAVFVGGLIGTTLRVLLDLAIVHDLEEFALSTLLVNLVGAFVLGLLVAALWPRVPGWVRVGLGPGILGSFTTFSALAVLDRRPGAGGRCRGRGPVDRAQHRARDDRRLARPRPRFPAHAWRVARDGGGRRVTLLVLLAVAVGGALGAVLRQLTSVILAGRGRIPWGVLVVNVVGSFVAGVALGAPLDPTVQLIIVSGVCGGLTTFSTFAVETIQLVSEGKHRAAAASVALNLAVGVPAALLGFALVALAG